MQKKYHSKGADMVRKYASEHQEKTFTAGDICEYVKENDLKINPTTVYRNLDKMTEAGQLLKLKAADTDCFCYQYVGKHENCSGHLHLRCRKCGATIHLEDEFACEFIRLVNKTYGFMIEAGDTSIGGLCKNCR
ncbi:Fur family transcriptional regulator, ferric uptake regulator [Lachnospiraceae bacterium KH1T2]|nr:Fur family transcriptional regulator, ferric uptake regulator [Lachnospiraceae bacterium KH1T2]